MSSEPLTTAPVSETSETAAETGLLVAVLLLVLLGTTAILLMS
ncbi:hypothetical protein GCM10010168_52810 [Actinoplanes ianthinogenes]|uniref:Uncharacterized protein n=1 Tax=Actinoplanes ianthinogenes TaxID=122358 RepID=A0ABM7LR62_9ACTN|nr:hypothetical protein [Actinoplanes ianthinogenes]BCJ41721.1 hypothetical protein Aiant_23780 [Actinoplanes ianthinogenes]GGR28180.1 hypothetical protein GCM10010168_52810 [Actinoplanes ianthinogenes]